MLKISDAVEDLVAANDSLRFGLHHRLFNLSELARFLQPLVEARTQKEVKASAIQMSLSRLQARLREDVERRTAEFRLDKVHIQPGLCSLTSEKSVRNHGDFGKLYNFIQSEQGFITLTEGVGEITAIFESKHLQQALRLLSAAPSIRRDQISSLGIRFHERFLDVPGVLHQILQTLALQGINVVELASTSTELTVYLHESDVELAFESIYRRFAGRLS